MAFAVARTLSLLSALAGATAGLVAIVSPTASAKQHDTPIGSSPDARYTEAWVRIFGGRNTMLSAAMVAFYLRGDDKALAVLMMSFMLGGIVDGLALQQVGAKSVARNHVVGGTVIAGIGAWLWYLS